MTKTIPAFIARTQFGQLMERAQRDRARFLVSKNGEPAVVILAVEDYLESVLKQPSALTNLQAAARKRGLNRLSLDDVNQEIAEVRKKRKKSTRG